MTRDTTYSVEFERYERDGPSRDQMVAELSAATQKLFPNGVPRNVSAIGMVFANQRIEAVYE